VKRTLLIAVVFGACHSAVAPSDAACDREKMIRVLYDIRLLEGMYSADQTLVDSSGGISAQYHFILQKHQISKEEFLSCYADISRNVEDIKRIEDSVRVKLENNAK